MTYSEKHDKLNRLVGKIEGTLFYWQSIKEPVPLRVVDRLIKMIAETESKTGGEK